jgi:group I intron endonuclease
MLIYSAKNKINGKLYVGKTSKSLDERKHRHIEESKNPKFLFHKAILRYGVDSFEWSVLEECKTEEELSTREVFWIEELGSHCSNHGYNVSYGGTGGKMPIDVEKRRRSSLVGHIVSDETRKKISEKNKGGTGGGAKKGCIPWNKGKKDVQKASDETKKKMSLGRKGVSKSAKHKEKLKAHLDKVRPNFSGKKWDDERKKKHSERLKRWHAERKDSF